MYILYRNGFGSAVAINHQEGDRLRGVFQITVGST